MEASGMDIATCSNDIPPPPFVLADLPLARETDADKRIRPGKVLSAISDVED
jgi:hypothetical protein